MMGYGSGMGSGWLFGLLMMVGLILLGVVLVRVMGGGLRRSDGDADRSSPGSPGASARRLLDERYARGEVSTEEYQERLRVLGQPD